RDGRRDRSATLLDSVPWHLARALRRDRESSRGRRRARRRGGHRPRDGPLPRTAPKERGMTGFLASYYYFRGYDFRGHPGPLIIDSGAFSAFTLGDTIDIRDYARFVTEVRAVAPGLLFAI